MFFVALDNIFSCGSSSVDDFEIERHKKRKKSRVSRRKSKSKRKHRKSSKFDDYSDEDFCDVDEEFQRNLREKLRKKKTLRDRKQFETASLPEDIKTETIPVGNVDNSKRTNANTENHQKAESSEYAYFVYKPEKNLVSVSRSLKSVLPPNTTVIYKTDDKTAPEVKSLINNETSPTIKSSNSSLHTNYYIVNSNRLLNQSKEKQNVKVEDKKSTETVFLYSAKVQLDLNEQKSKEKICPTNEESKLQIRQSLTNNGNYDEIRRLARKARERQHDSSEQEFSDEESLENNRNRRRRLQQLNLSKRKSKDRKKRRSRKEKLLDRETAASRRKISKSRRSKKRRSHRRSSSYDDDD